MLGVAAMSSIHIPSMVIGVLNQLFQVFNMVLAHPDKNNTVESWTSKGSKEEMMEFYKGRMHDVPRRRNADTEYQTGTAS
jgi:hypothetical protein